MNFSQSTTKTLLSCALAALLTGIASAAEPTDVVTSDASGNTAMGKLALYALATPNCSAGTSCYNTAAGAGALYDTTTGQKNTALGYQTLYYNKSGDDNAAVGMHSLYYNTTGSQNDAFGEHALFANTEGVGNTAIGHYTLDSNLTGSYNTALGWYSGTAITGADNVDIANYGVSSDYGVMRFGTAGEQTATYISGISTTRVTGAAVYVTASGQLGVLASSERYKNRIQTMGEKTDKMQLLRPVTFHLKNEPQGQVQYGLIAEEVVKVYPELVIRDDTGKIQGVRYDELAPMLLNEMQKQQSKIALQDAKIRAQDDKFAQLVKINDSLRAAITDLIGKDQRLAQAN
jgi:trimeric autotransporter adhesin